MYSPTKYRISTITATGSVSTDVNLETLFSHLCNIIDEEGVGKREDIVEGVVYAEYGEKRSHVFATGLIKKSLAQRKKEHADKKAHAKQGGDNTNMKESTTKKFDNQLTVVYRYSAESSMNIKIFKNGNIQITGIKHIQEGEDMIGKLIVLIKNALQNKIQVVESSEKLENKRYKVALINSDFKIGFEIKRDKLYTILINKYDNKCSFEPCIYPGVKIQYYWNTNNVHKNGVCECASHCLVGKGDGHGEANCKKITIAVFQSGCIIITGAQSTIQIDDAYDFICNVLQTHMEYVKKVATILPVLPKVEAKPKVLLRKSTVVYPNGHPSSSSIR